MDTEWRLLRGLVVHYLQVEANKLKCHAFFLFEDMLENSTMETDELQYLSGVRRQ